MSSFQCSALTKAEGIRKLFEQCMRYQSKQDPKKYVSVVALDEIGLAEDSPHMPLKILHALLESGSVIDDNTDYMRNPSKKLGFLGISNWALDPAKMNRGIFVTRGVPSEDELLQTVTGIFTGYRSESTSNMEQVLHALVSAYIQVTSDSESEYFGLRDLYSLVKTIKKTILKNGERDPVLTLQEAMDAVSTNFSGGRELHEEAFKTCLIESGQFNDETYEGRNISDIMDSNLESQGRHLLLLTKQFFPLNMLTSALRSSKNEKIAKRAENIQVIYGSAFPGDDNYAALCRNVNKIKVCMENDCIAIILNLRKIHESLYDALNQHYVTLGNYKYVDLGFGSSEHRIKCRVHDEFRMIFVEDTDIAYEEYPAPLINRLEKHHFSSQRLLTEKQEQQAKVLKDWLEHFARFEMEMPCSFDETDAFTGYHDNFANALVLVHGYENTADPQSDNSIIDSLKSRLLKCATVDSVLRLKSKQSAEMASLHKTYFEQQRHENLLDFLRNQLHTDSEAVKICDLTTFSSLLMENDRQEIEKSLFPNADGCIILLSLQSSETLQQFSDKVDRFFAKPAPKREGVKDNLEHPVSMDYRKILLIQCNSAHKNMDLIACARYCLESKLKENNATADGKKLVLSFLLSTTRQCSVNANRLFLQPTTNGDIIYIDELRPVNPSGPMSDYLQFSLGKILRKGFDNYLDMRNTEGKYICKSLDVHRLLLSCFSESLARLTSSGSRDEERIPLLKKLLDHKDFTRILFGKIVSIFEAKDLENKEVETQWILDEACDSVKLLEAGTFQKAIWLSLKEKLSTVFAYITSIIDGNCNLDLALAEEGTFSWSAKLWMSIFENLEFSSTAEKSDQVIQVKNFHTFDMYKFRFPFGFCLFNKVIGMWEAVDQDRTDIFVDSISNLNIWPPVDDCFMSGGNEVLEVLLTDMTRMAYKPRGSGTTKEIDAVLRIVKNWVMGCKKSREDTTQLASSTVKFLRLQKYFDQLSRIFETWPEMTDSSEFEVPQCKHVTDILQHAFDKLVEILTSKISELTMANCPKWMDEVYSITQIFNSFSEKTTLKSNKWALISLLHLLFTQLTPRNTSEKVYHRYLQVIAEEAKNLGLMLEDEPESIYKEDGLKLIFKALAKCFSDLKYRLLVDWADPRCKLCAKLMIEPRKLQCGHYVCKPCMQTSSMSSCTECGEQLENDAKDFIDKELVLSSTSLEELNDFKIKCTNFFLKYMKIFVNDEAAYDIILKKILLHDSSFSPVGYTKTTQSSKQLDIHQFLDLNIMTKSFIFEYLLEKHRVATVDQLNSHFETIPLNDMKNLISAIILHFESSLKPQTESLENIFTEIKRYGRINLQTLEYVAKIRRGIEDNALKINNEVKKSGCIEEVEIPKALQVFEPDAQNVLRFYFIRYGSTRFGPNWLGLLANSPLVSKLIPTSVTKWMQVIDLWQMLGEEYSLKLTQQNQCDMSILDCFEEINELAPLFASFSQTMQNTESEKNFMRSLRQCTTGLKATVQSGVSKIMRIYCSEFVKRNPTDRPLIQVLVMAAIAIRKQPFLMSQFSYILQCPEKIKDLFLPTMPEFLFFPVTKRARTKDLNWHAEILANKFACPKGHMYITDICKRPQEQRKCQICKENIGRDEDKLDPGNAGLEEAGKSQKGYILDNVMSPPNDNDNPDDRMSKHGVAVTRFILHSTLLLVVCKNKENFRSVSQFKDQTRAGFISYLLDQLRKDLDDLACALQRNKGDAYIVTYRILEHIITKKVSADAANQSSSWSTIALRKRWEQKFMEVFLLPIFGNVDDVLDNGWNMMKEMGEIDRLVRDLPIQPHEEETWSHPILWRALKHLEIKSLLRHIMDSPGSRKCAILQAILSRRNLGSSRFIKPVLDLQSALIKRYQYKVDLVEADKITFSEYIREDETKRELVELYFVAWKMTQAHRRLGDTCHELTMDSSISFALPNKRGKGKFAMMLSITLIGLHNEFLENCATILPELKLEEVSVSELHETNIAYVDKKRDLLQLIKMHTKYDIVPDGLSGSRHHIVHDFDEIEILVREMYVRHKKLIKVKTIPTIQYSQDTGVSEEWPALKKLIIQENLSAGLESSVDAKISENPPAELYESVRTLSHAIRFLVKSQTISAPGKSLRNYMEETLLMDAKLLSLFPSSAKLNHALALYQHLTWHKSVSFVRQGINPYQDALPEGQQEIPSELGDEVKTAFKGVNALQLQKRINEILITNPDYNENLSLIEKIFPYAPYLDEDEDNSDKSWFKSLPKKLCFCHISHLFKMTAEFIDRKA